MGIYTKDEQLEMIKNDIFGFTLKEIDNQYEDVCLEAIRKDTESLKYVKNQTEGLCLEAVKKYGPALKDVRNQTLEICLEAIKQNKYAFQFVDEKYKHECSKYIENNSINEKKSLEERILKGVKINGYIIRGCEIKTPEVCFYAFLNRYDLLKYKYISKGVGEFIDNNKGITNEIFCINKYQLNLSSEISYFDINSLIHLKNFLLKENSNNIYIFYDEIFEYEEKYLELLKEISLSNNELIIIDEGNIKDIHKVLANKIITRDEFRKGAF